LLISGATQAKCVALLFSEIWLWRKKTVQSVAKHLAVSQTAEAAGAKTCR